jgi:hypothetical protein
MLVAGSLPPPLGGYEGQDEQNLHKAIQGNGVNGGGGGGGAGPQSSR